MLLAGANQPLAIMDDSSKLEDSLILYNSVGGKYRDHHADILVRDEQTYEPKQQ